MIEMIDLWTMGEHPAHLIAQFLVDLETYMDIEVNGNKVNKWFSQTVKTPITLTHESVFETDEDALVYFWECVRDPASSYMEGML